MPFSKPSPSEVRGVVRAASERTKIPMVKAWLFDDGKGFWEKEALNLLTSEETHTRAVALGITTDTELRDVVSDRLVYLALTAVEKKA